MINVIKIKKNASNNNIKALFLRLNKIGKNPHLVSNRETLDSDCKTMNAIVNALSGGGSDVGSMESLPQSFHPRNNLR